MTQLALNGPGLAYGQAPPQIKPAAPAPADATAEAKKKLLKARAMLAQGDFNGAEALAKDVAQARLKYGYREDTPAKVLGDIARARTDPKALLSASRSALARRDFDNAERYAKMADRYAGLFTFPMWADSPAKALKDIKAARKQAAAPAPAPRVVTKAPEAPKPAKPATPATPAKPATTKTGAVLKTKADCVAVLARGRKALTAGKLQDAAVLAQQANVPGVSWGLFEDTPDKLTREVLAAQQKRNRDEAAKLLANGRKLYAAGKFDDAAKLAYRSQTLFNDYSMWDLGDRPSKLLAACHQAKQAARQTKLPPATAVARKEVPPPTAVVRKEVPPPSVKPQPPETDKPKSTYAAVTPTPPPVKLAPPPAVDANKAQATRLVSEAIALHKEGKLVAAREKALQAQKLKAPFSAQEVSPDLVYQQVASDASRQVYALARQADQSLNHGLGGPEARNKAALAKLAEARQLAAVFLQDTRYLDDRIARLNAPPAAPAAGGLRTVNYTPDHGHLLLQKARAELRKGEPGTARKMAEEALTGNHGVREEAMALLRTIDVEEFNQKKLRSIAAFDAAESALRRSDYRSAKGILANIDAKMLDAPRQARMREINMLPGMADSRPSAELVAGPSSPTVSDAVPTPGIERTVGVLPQIGSPGTPGRATVTDRRPTMGTPAQPRDSQILDEYKQRQTVMFQNMRQKGLEAQSRAYEKFRSGQPQEAIDLLNDYLTDLSGTKLEQNQVLLLRRPVDSRIKMFQLMRDQKALAAGARARQEEGMKKVKDRVEAEAQKKKDIKILMDKYNALFKGRKYDEAEKQALAARELDPDDPLITAAITICRMQRNRMKIKDVNDRRRDMFVEAMDEAEDMGPPEAIRKGWHLTEKQKKELAKRRGIGPIKIDRKSEKEKTIERKLLSPVTLNFEATPLKQVIDDLRDYNGINIVPDLPAMTRAGISLDNPISIKLNNVSLKSALTLILHQAHLTYQIQSEVLQITTEEEAKGQLTIVTHSVADLVLNLDPGAQPSLTALGQAVTNANPATPSGYQYTPTPVTTPQSMGAGYPVGTPSGPGAGYPLTNNNGGGVPMINKYRPPTQEEQLISLLTKSVSPSSWAEMGGKGTIEFHPLTLSLVISQTPDIQEQIQDLLQALRRLQDQSVSVEVRMITVTEEFFERIGVNFAMNILTDKANKRFEPQLLGGNFVGNTAQFINAFDPKRFIAGLTPAGTLTPTLDIPISQQSFYQTFPTFGGYTGGGLNVGLAFLSDIQVFLFLEALQGDLRNNVMQAPKITCYNGQTASVNVSDQQNFLVNVQVLGLPGGQFYLQPTIVPVGNQVSLTVQPVITADRRFVRINLQPNLTSFLPGPIPQIPVVVPLFTSVDGITSGQPVVFTQYLQAPQTATITVQTTVQVPDGGTVVMGGLKRLAESRSEYGPPVVSKIPYLNRLFKNVGYGRDTESLLIMVSVRILILGEEELRATGFDSYSESAVSGY
jgi:type II secretory pathway component GspD/PulD (secretin)